MHQATLPKTKFQGLPEQVHLFPLKPKARGRWQLRARHAKGPTEAGSCTITHAEGRKTWPWQAGIRLGSQNE